MLQYDLDVEPGEKEPRPMFVHSFVQKHSTVSLALNLVHRNLLKHISGVGRGHTFTHLVRDSIFLISAANLPSLLETHDKS